MSDSAAILWLRQDLRLADHAALCAAAAGGRPVVPVFIIDDAAAGAFAAGGASRWWLHGSLSALAGGLAALGSRLILRRGRTLDILPRLAAETGASAIYCTRAYEPVAAALEREVSEACRGRGVTLHRYSGALLHEPEAVSTQSGEPYRVFTPFWRALSGLPRRTPVKAPDRLTAPAAWPASETLATWNLRPTRPDWAGGLHETWIPGELGAVQRLETMIAGPMARYPRDRDRPDMASTSMLSPHLHFGEISPTHCRHAIDHARAGQPRLEAGAASLVRQIGWREFSYHLLHHWPHIADQPFRPTFANFAWDDDPDRVERHFQAWCRGRTGYPIVDAGMRQLWQTGWMHNRVRMVTASFLTKHLLVPWQRGAAWFWDTLVDADLANNAAGWQWVAGSGADAAPYFRIFNPVLQGQKFDPDGAYVRRFVPELAALGARDIQSPWLASADTLARAGVRLGETYPHPIVEHAQARAAALSAYAALP